MTIQGLSKSPIARLYAVYVMILFALVVLAVGIEKGQDVLWINGHHTNIQDDIFKLVTNGGDGLIFVPIIIITLFIRFQYAIVALVATLFSGIVSILFKQVLFDGAARPKRVLDNDLLYFVPGVDVHATNSFASGHTITAFCAALFITLVAKNRIVSVACLVFALLVAYSRIYLLQHFLIDIAGGAVIGCLSTFIVWSIFEMSSKPEWMSKHISININSPHRPPDSGQYNRVS